MSQSKYRKDSEETHVYTFYIYVCFHIIEHANTAVNKWCFPYQLCYESYTEMLTFAQTLVIKKMPAFCALYWNAEVKITFMHEKVKQGFLQNIKRLYIICFEFRHKIPLINIAPFPHRPWLKAVFLIKDDSINPSRNWTAWRILLWEWSISRGRGPFIWVLCSEICNSFGLKTQKTVSFYSPGPQMNTSSFFG